MKTVINSQKNKENAYNIEAYNDLKTNLDVLKIKANFETLNEVSEIIIQGFFELSESEIIEQAKKYLWNIERKVLGFVFGESVGLLGYDEIASCFQYIKSFEIVFSSDYSHLIENEIGRIANMIISDFEDNIEKVSVSIENKVSFSIDTNEFENSQEVLIKNNENFLKLKDGNLELKSDWYSTFFLLEQLSELKYKNLLLYSNNQIKKHLTMGY